MLDQRGGNWKIEIVLAEIISEETMWKTPIENEIFWAKIIVLTAWEFWKMMEQKIAARIPDDFGEPRNADGIRMKISNASFRRLASE